MTDESFLSCLLTVVGNAIVVGVLVVLVLVQDAVVVVIGVI
jgi:hypothetical protein